MKGPALAVFVSYRRSDVSGYAGRITDTLVSLAPAPQRTCPTDRRVR
jgi:hypothetical protein